MRKQEPAISRVLSSTTIHLGQPSPVASSNLPGSPLGTGGAAMLLLPYLVLLRAGFAVPRPVTSRAVRSYRTFSPLPAEAGGIFSVALSMGSHPPGVTWRPVRRSPDFPLYAKDLQRLPGRLLLSRTADSTANSTLSAICTPNYLTTWLSLVIMTTELSFWS